MKMTITEEKLQKKIDYINEWSYSLQDCKEQLVIEKDKLEKMSEKIKHLKRPIVEALFYVIEHPEVLSNKS